MSIDSQKLKNIIEAALMAIAKPMPIEQLAKLFEDEQRPSNSNIKDALTELQQETHGRGIELKEVASGFRYQAREEYSEWLSRMWEEKPAKYSRAALETLALIAYRQPVTRAEIEDVRGVGVSSSIIKTMMEREWIRVVGHRDVPGRPALYATTKQFLDYFNMHSLEELPTLAEIKDLDEIHPELDLPNPDDERLIAPPSIVEPSESKEIKLEEIESNETGSDETDSDSDETGSGETDSDETGSDRSGSDEVDANEIGAQSNESNQEAPELDGSDNLEADLNENEETDELNDIHTETSGESFYADQQNETDKTTDTDDADDTPSVDSLTSNEILALKDL